MKTLFTTLILGFALHVQAQLITGSPDSNFNTNGFHFWEAGNGEILNDVAVDGLGFIWAVGNRYNPDGRVIVTRLKPDGTVDPFFGTNGVLEINPTVNEDDFGQGIVILNDGTAVIACFSSALNKNIVFYRIMKNGSVDPNWGNAGRLDIDESNTDAFRRMILDANGKIVMVGTSKGTNDNDILVARITSDGQRDSSFNVDGVTLFDVNGKINTGQDITERPGGGYYVVSTADDGKTYVNALSDNGNGRLDFNNKVFYSYVSGANTTQMYNILVDTAGNIVLGGRIDNSGNFDAHMARFKPNGNLDLSFNGTGSNNFFPVPANPNDESIVKMLLQDDGKFLFCTQYGTEEYAIFRVKPDGVQDPFFGNGNGYYKGTPDANTNFFNVNSMAFTDVDSQAIIVGNIYLGPDDYLYYHAFYYNTDKPSPGGGTGFAKQAVSRLNVYPNPSRGQFELDLPEASENQIQVFSIQGQLMHVAQNSRKLDLSTLPNGVYHVMVSQDTELFQAKIQILR